jgi:hypothetical protein
VGLAVEAGRRRGIALIGWGLKGERRRGSFGIFRWSVAASGGISGSGVPAEDILGYFGSG